MKQEAVEPSCVDGAVVQRSVGVDGTALWDSLWEAGQPARGQASDGTFSDGFVLDHHSGSSANFICACGLSFHSYTEMQTHNHTETCVSTQQSPAPIAAQQDVRPKPRSKPRKNPKTPKPVVQVGAPLLPPVRAPTVSRQIVDLWRRFKPVVKLQSLPWAEQRVEPWAEQRLRCGECGRVLFTQDELVQHVGIHAKSNVYGCRSCGELLIGRVAPRAAHRCGGFTTTPSTRFTFGKVHKDPFFSETSPCPHCGVRFCNPRTLNKHILTNHAKVTPPTTAPFTVTPPNPAPFTFTPPTVTPPTAAPFTVTPSTAALFTITPPTATPFTVAPLTAAPFTVTPPTAALFTITPPTAAPFSAAPPTAAPPTAAPFTVTLSTATPLTAAPLTVTPPTSTPPTAVVKAPVMTAAPPPLRCVLCGQGLHSVHMLALHWCRVQLTGRKSKASVRRGDDPLPPATGLGEVTVRFQKVRHLETLSCSELLTITSPPVELNVRMTQTNLSHVSIKREVEQEQGYGVQKVEVDQMHGEQVTEVEEPGVEVAQGYGLQIMEVEQEDGVEEEYGVEIIEVEQEDGVEEVEVKQEDGVENSEAEVYQRSSSKAFTQTG